MHLNTKKIAFAGIMLALTEVGIALGSVIETNTRYFMSQKKLRLLIHPEALPEKCHIVSIIRI